MNNRILKRISALVLCFAVLFSAFGVFSAVTAAEEPSELYKAHSIPAKGIADTEGKFAVENYKETTEAEIEGFTLTAAQFRGIDSLFINRDEEEGAWPVTLSKTYEEPLDLSEYKELYLRIYAGATVEGEHIELEITLRSGATDHTVITTTELGGEYDVYLPVSAFDKLDSINEIVITLSCPEEIRSIIMSALYADKSYSYSHIPLFSSDKLTSENGMELYENRIEPTVKDGSADVTAELAGVPEDAKTICTMVTASGAEAGTMTLSVWNGKAEEYTDIATLTLSSGKNRYSFMFPAFKGTKNYMLTFAGVSETEGEALTLHGAVMTCFEDEVYDKTDYPCSISSCSVLEGGAKIRLGGTLRSSAVVNNLGAKLNVYAKDDRYGTEDGNILMASLDITTVFEITFDTGSLKLNPHLYKYFITIQANETEEIASASVSPAVTPDSFTTGSSVLGIQSSEAADVFRTNASHAVVDVYLDRLLSTDGKGGRVHSYGGSFSYLSGSYITELDSKISFLDGSGVNVYLRILSENKNPDVPAIYVVPDSRDYAASLSYMTMIDFLSSRYSGISGIILGSRVDCMLYSYTEEESLITRAENYAELLRLTCIAARPNAPEAAVIVPFGDGYVYGGDGDGANYLYDPLSGMGKHGADPVMVSEVISQMISTLGSFRWYLLYECESAPTDAMTTAYKLSSQLTQGIGTSPSGHMVFWQPEKAISSKEIKELSEGISENAVSMGTGAVIISFTRHAIDPSSVIDTIEKIPFGENDSRNVTEHEGLVLRRPAPQGRYDLWDFTKSFSTESFIFAGAVTSLSTEVSIPMAAFEGLDSCRCLSGSLDSESKSSGTVLCYFDTPKLLKNATSFDVSINALSDAKKEIPVKVIIGKGNVRYEYSAQLSPSTPSVIRCDTSVMDDKFAAEYVAVSIEPQSADSFEITKISAINKDVSENALHEMLEASEKTRGEITEESKFILTAVAFIGVTVIAFAMLNVKPGSDKKDKNA
ncbi:MAG: hypothetical protein E7660_05635 [Ruminococcaceae bacterium]|nr:hypothetical protein [Oscillospiraceae bacterium]